MKHELQAVKGTGCYLEAMNTGRRPTVLVASVEGLFSPIGEQAAEFVVHDK